MIAAVNIVLVGGGQTAFRMLGEREVIADRTASLGAGRTGLVEASLV